MRQELTSVPGNWAAGQAPSEARPNREGMTLLADLPGWPHQPNRRTKTESGLQADSPKLLQPRLTKAAETLSPTFRPLTRSIPLTTFPKTE